MTVFRGITNDIKPIRDRRIISRAKTTLSPLRLETASLKTPKLSVAFAIGQNIRMLFGLPRKYYENNDTKRVSERIGKSLVIDEEENLFCIKDMKVDWKDGVPLEERSKTSLGKEVYKAIRRWLPGYIFLVRKEDGTVFDDYYIKLLEDNPSFLSVGRVLSFLNKRRAQASALGFEFKGKLIEDLEKLGITEDKIEKLATAPKLEVGVKIWASDEHMGGGGPADDFMINKNAFKNFLSWVKRAADFLKKEGIKLYLIFPGDLIEKWQFEFDEILEKHKDILEMVLELGIDIYYVYGNHDMEMAELENYMILGKNGTRIFIVEKVFDDDAVWIHGHQADPFNKKVEERNAKIKASHTKGEAPIGSKVTRIVKYFEYIWPNIDEWLDAWRKRLTPAKARRKMDVDNYIPLFTALRDEALRAGRPISIFEVNMGHTHVIDFGNKDTELGQYLRNCPSLNIIYYNDGTWAESTHPEQRGIGIKNSKGEVEIFRLGQKPKISIV